ncbi:Uncharacterised protein [BD1-7 clade bacterium]|uniref:DUF2218 domain-containing protein n=1 Tax=BD1-7 clade bacterium TaxID=2029982 RepID=A0A5S9PGG7_9GAMM|nr:Uncharacterised protein [BD1-7 clade bacterium]
MQELPAAASAPNSVSVSAAEVCVISSVVIDDPSRALKRMCKHFAHKVSAHWDDDEGTVDFAMGKCRMRASGDTLRFICSAPSTSELSEITETIDRHVLHFLKAGHAAPIWQPCAKQ